MRKLIASAVVAVSVLLSGGTALAASAGPDDQFNRIVTAPNGHIECSRHRDEIGDSIAPGYLYVNVMTSRQDQLYCAHGWQQQFASEIVHVDPKVWAYGLYGWFVCADPPGHAAGLNDYQVQDIWVFPSCGHLQYYVEVWHQVTMFDGVWFYTNAVPLVYPIWLG